MFSLDLTFCECRASHSDDRDCTQKILDIIFVVDDSGSINYSEMTEQKNFVENFAASFNISDSNTRVGLIKYHSWSTVLKNLTVQNSFSDLQTALSRLSSGSYSTNIGSGLAEMTEMFAFQGLAFCYFDNFHEMLTRHVK